MTLVTGSLDLVLERVEGPVSPSCKQASLAPRSPIETRQRGGAGLRSKSKDGFVNAVEGAFVTG